MIKLFIETWLIQDWNWRGWYLVGFSGIGYILYSIIKMSIISFRLKLAEKKYATTRISNSLDEMYRKLEAGIEVKPSKYLK